MKSRDELHRLNRDKTIQGLPFLILLNKSDLTDEKMNQDHILGSLDIDDIENGTTDLPGR